LFARIFVLVRIQISRGSVTADLRWGGSICFGLFHSLSPSAKVEAYRNWPCLLKLSKK